MERWHITQGERMADLMRMVASDGSMQCSVQLVLLGHFVNQSALSYISPCVWNTAGQRGWGRHRLALPLFLYPLPFTGPASALFPSSPTPLRIRLRDVFTFPTIHRYGRQTENGKMMTFGDPYQVAFRKFVFPVVGSRRPSTT